MPRDQSSEPEKNPCLRVLTGPASGRLLRLDKPEMYLGRGTGNDLVLEDARVSRVHARLNQSDDQVVLTDLDSTNGTWVAGLQLRGSKNLLQGEQIVLGGSIVLRFGYCEDPPAEDLQEHATVDALTGALNLPALRQRLSQEFELSRAQNLPLSAALLDLDHFRRVNSTFGHRTGDAVLVELARRVRKTLRPRDFLARSRGGEFTLVLPDCPLEPALDLLERIRREVGESFFEVPVPEGRRDIAVTISAGVVCLGEDHPTVEALLGSADVFLYQAKQAGRNRVVSSRGSGLALPRQRRKLTRLACKIAVAGRTQGQEFAATVKDMGLQGMRLEVPQELEAGSPLSLTCPELEGPPVEVRVVWCRRRKLSETIQVGVLYADDPQSWVKASLHRLGFDTVSAEERRGSLRAEVDLAVVIRAASGGDLSGRVLNLGFGGALLEAPGELPGGASLRLDIQTPGTQPLLACWATLVHCRPGPRSGQWLWGTSFASKDMDPALTSFVLSLLDETV